MYQISEHINSSNHNIHSRDQMSKIIVYLGGKKFKKQLQILLPNYLSTEFITNEYF